MGFTEHKITAFTHRISDLPDQPTLSPEELKARFDSSPEELRAAHNAVCDEGEALAARIDAYRAQTFTGEITRDMLAPAVREELSGKAEAAANDAAHEAFSEQIAQKCELYIGSYIGDGEVSQFIDLGFTPKALFVGFPASDTRGFVTQGIEQTLNGYPTLKIVENGFIAYLYSAYRVYFNASGSTAFYAALK